MERTFAAAFMILWSSVAFGQAQMIPGDYYIRSQNPNGVFIGYHRLMTQPEDGYLPARYCDRQFWVRKSTVLWTENEAKAGRNLVIEVNNQDTRKVVCDNPGKYVTLETIGLKKSEIDILRGQAGEVFTTRGRLSHISKAFSKK